MATFLFYSVLLMIVLFILVALVGYQVENYLSDDNSFKLWWRRHIVDYDPNDEEVDDKAE